MSANRLRQLPGLLRTLAAPRRYADLEPMTRPAQIMHTLRRLPRALAALPSELRNAPPIPKDTGAGHILRRERNAWVIRPATGWRAHIGPPLHTNRALGPTEEDAASDWAAQVTAAND
jgi:hypothetical protein